MTLYPNAFIGPGDCRGGNGYCATHDQRVSECDNERLYGELHKADQRIERLAASVRDLEEEAALWRKNLEDAQSDLAGEVEAHRLEREARVRAEGERDGIDALWLKARFDAVDAHQRIAALEAALRGARQRVDEYDNRLCWCRNLRMFADSLHDHGCRSARAALAPPERP